LAKSAELKSCAHLEETPRSYARLALALMLAMTRHGERRNEQALPSQTCARPWRGHGRPAAGHSQYAADHGAVGDPKVRGPMGAGWGGSPSRLPWASASAKRGHARPNDSEFEPIRNGSSAAGRGDDTSPMHNRSIALP
jgi:hypothetical protein